MTYKVADIIAEYKKHWVLRRKDSFAVMRKSECYSQSIAHFALDVDGLSLAIGYASGKDNMGLSSQDCVDLAEAYYKERK